MFQRLKAILKKLFAPVSLNTAHFICPRCYGSMYADFNPNAPYPVYCAPCDKTYIAVSELVESHPITWEDRLTEHYYLGKPKARP